MAKLYVQLSSSDYHLGCYKAADEAYLAATRQHCGRVALAAEQIILALPSLARCLAAGAEQITNAFRFACLWYGDKGTLSVHQQAFVRAVTLFLLYLWCLIQRSLDRRMTLNIAAESAIRTMA